MHETGCNLHKGINARSVGWGTGEGVEGACRTKGLDDLWVYQDKVSGLKRPDPSLTDS